MTYQNGAAAANKARYFATIFARPGMRSASHTNGVPGAPVDELIAAINKHIAPANYVAHRVLGLNAGGQVVEVCFTTNKAVKIADFNQNDAFTTVQDKFGIQVSVQSGPPKSPKRMAFFDMDSTLIEQEVIDEIARKLNVEKQVSEITERAMNGELDFTASLKERVSLLKGTPTTVFDELKGVITFTPGVKDLVKALQKLGYKTAVLSGGFTPIARWVADQLGLDYVRANNLVVSEDGQYLTGEVTGDIVNAERKRDYVEELAAREGVPLDQVLVVGDGANDLKMMGVAGLGVAYNAKPKVQREAPARLNSTSMLDVLYLMGFTRVEIDELIASET